MRLNQRKTESAPPIIERQVIGGEPAHQPYITPEVSWLLQRSSQFHLTQTQTSALTKLRGEWDLKSKLIRTELDSASRDFQAFMRSRGGRASVSDIQSHSGPVSELSREYSGLRRVYWQKALGVLTKDQRASIEGVLKRCEGVRRYGSGGSRHMSLDTGFCR